MRTGRRIVQRLFLGICALFFHAGGRALVRVLVPDRRRHGCATDPGEARFSYFPGSTLEPGARASSAYPAASCRSASSG